MPRLAVRPDRGADRAGPAASDAPPPAAGRNTPIRSVCLAMSAAEMNLLPCDRDPGAALHDTAAVGSSRMISRPEAFRNSIP